MSDHNTLDDLVRVAESFVIRCEDGPDCDAPATCRTTTGLHLCDRCASEGYEGTKMWDSGDAPAIRRLVAAGVLV